MLNNHNGSYSQPVPSESFLNAFYVIFEIGAVESLTIESYTLE